MQNRNSKLHSLTFATRNQATLNNRNGAVKRFPFSFRPILHICMNTSVVWAQGAALNLCNVLGKQMLQMQNQGWISKLTSFYNTQTAPKRKCRKCTVFLIASRHVNDTTKYIFKQLLLSMPDLKRSVASFIFSIRWKLNPVHSIDPTWSIRFKLIRVKKHDNYKIGIGAPIALSYSWTKPSILNVKKRVIYDVIHLTQTGYW